MGFGSVTDLYFVLQLINKTYPLPIRPDPRKSLFETRFPNPCTAIDCPNGGVVRLEGDAIAEAREEAERCEYRRLT